jgi:hypothetical protein
MASSTRHRALLMPPLEAVDDLGGVERRRFVRLSRPERRKSAVGKLHRQQEIHTLGCALALPVVAERLASASSVGTI